MEIIQLATTRKFELRDSFLEPYYAKGDPFTSLLARSTYLNKYCRGGETWTDTIKRVIEGNLSLDPRTTQTEGELLYHLCWTGQVLPPGRGLWTGGLDNIPADARYNCWATTLYSIDDWCWVMNQLMLGGGVGVGLAGIHRLPFVEQGPARLSVRCRADHPDVEEVGTTKPDLLNGQTPIFCAPDSREGWVECLRRVLTAAFQGTDLIVDLSDIRPRGMPIKTFGGVACGPGPLAQLLREAHHIVRGAAGRQLSSIECLDITNYVGYCVKSGNVRRSAILVLGDADDQAFRNAKKDWEAVKSHRHTSNNSIMLHRKEQIDDFNWAELVEDNSTYGEPGIFNLWLAQQTDPGVTVINPCGEMPLHDREACNLAEVFPAQFEDGTDPEVAIRLAARYCLRQRLTPLLDAQSDRKRKETMRVGVGLGGLCDFEWTPETLTKWYGYARQEADSYAADLGVARPASVSTVKPSGTISLLNGSSPGEHAPWDAFNIRRVRTAVNDPMAYALMDAGVPYELDVYDSTNRMLVFSFPQKALSGRVTVQTQTVRDQFERQAMLQTYWSDSAVSATITFREDEKDELIQCMKDYVPRLKSTTCLPAVHGYEQAPYESIDEAAYLKLYQQIDHGHPLTRGGDFEIEDCAGGVCPIR